jgi:Domain of unknown function (DUF5615)
MPEARRPIYADENVRRRLVEALRGRGFDVLTARDVGLLGEDDDAQLAYAASTGRVLLTFNRGDFRRRHAQYVAAGRRHAGVALLPQRGPLERLVIRACLLLDWLTSLEPSESRLVNWNDLQVRLHRGERVVGYDEADARLALGMVARD